MPKLLVSFLIGVCALIPAVGYAEPTTDPVTVTSVRVYTSGGIYIAVSPVGLCGTDTFRIEPTAAARKEMYATILVAIARSDRVRLEVSNATGCNGWGTSLQSVYYVPGT